MCVCFTGEKVVEKRSIDLEVRVNRYGLVEIPLLIAEQVLRNLVPAPGNKHMPQKAPKDKGNVHVRHGPKRHVIVALSLSTCSMNPELV